MWNVHHSRSPPGIEAVADGEHELVITQVAAVGGEASLQVIVRPQCRFDRTGDEARSRVLVVSVEAKFCCPMRTSSRRSITQLPRQRKGLV